MKTHTLVKSFLEKNLQCEKLVLTTFSNEQI